MYKWFIGIVVLILAGVLGFTFMPSSMKVDYIMEGYKTTTVYDDKKKNSFKLVATAEEAVSEIKNVMSKGDPMTLTFPIKTPEGEKIRNVSPFGYRNGVQGSGEFHLGTDLNPQTPNTKGITIRAATPGKVVTSGYGAIHVSYGNVVDIKDERTGLIYRYAHLDSRALKVGDVVKEGDTVGVMGTTPGYPYSTGVHLHFEVRVGSVLPGVKFNAGDVHNGKVVNALNPKYFKYKSSTKPDGGVTNGNSSSQVNINWVE